MGMWLSRQEQRVMSYWYMRLIWRLAGGGRGRCLRSRGIGERSIIGGWWNRLEWWSRSCWISAVQKGQDSPPSWELLHSGRYTSAYQDHGSESPPDKNSASGGNCALRSNSLQRLANSRPYC